MFNRNLESKSLQSEEIETILLTSIDDLESAAFLHRFSFPIVNEEYSNKIQHKIEIRIKEIRKTTNHLPDGQNQTASRIFRTNAVVC